MSDIVQDGGIQADKCGEGFNNCSRPLSDLESHFLTMYKGGLGAELRPNEGTHWIDPNVLEQIDKMPDRHPAVEEALRIVLQNPEKYGVDVEKNGLIGRSLGRGEHDFSQTPLPASGTEPGPSG